MECFRYFLIYILTIYAFSADAAPSNRHVSSEEMNNHAKDWLIKYGYLTDSSDVTLFEHTMAIMNMQHFHKLPVTGVIDREEFNIMQRTRCGCPDMMADDEMQALGDNATSVGQLERFRRYVVNRDRDVWPSNDLTYRFNDFTSDLPSTVQEEEMRKAASKWSAASRLSITRSSTSTSDIQVAFRRLDHGDNYPFDGPFDVLAHAFSPGTGLGGDIHFDDDEQFTVNSATGADFTFIALHEMGHSLGLEHSNNPDAVMSMFFTNNPSDIQLHNDDIAGIQSLYGRPEGVEAVIEIEVATVPVTCTKVYDAIADVGASFFFFREGSLIQATNSFTPINQPISLGFIFPGGPSRVDAAYVSDTYWVTIFQGSTYWRYNFQTFALDPSTPSSISDFGVPVLSIDAVLYKNNEVYLFKDSFFWRYSTITRTSQGPKHIQSEWGAVTTDALTPLTSVFYQQTHDRLFFVSGTTYWTYNSERVFQDDGDLNMEYTNELCLWCQYQDPGAADNIVPKLLITIIGAIFANLIKS